MLKGPFFKGKFALTGVNFGFYFAFFYYATFPTFDKHMKFSSSGQLQDDEDDKEYNKDKKDDEQSKKKMNIIVLDD